MVGKAIPSTGTIISNDAHGISCNNTNNLTDCDDETLQIKHPYYLRAKQSRIVHKERIAPLRSSPDDDYGGLRDEEEDLTDCFVMPSNNSCDAYGCNNVNGDSKGKQVADKDHLFQCKACKKVFGSHQALGGHRASHKKVKGCYAAKVDEQNDNDEDDEDFESLSYESDLEPIGTEHCERAKLKMHECSVCRRVFSSGQALGGHKRCHWLTNSSDNSFVPSFHDFQNLPRLNLCLDQCLDLNLKLTAPSLDDQESTRLYLQQLKEKIEGGEDEGHNKGCEKLMRNLSELNDLNPTDEGWLQVGISSAADSRN